jgi:hypothetical protein
MKSRRGTDFGKGGEGFDLHDLKEAGESNSAADALVDKGEDIEIEVEIPPRTPEKGAAFANNS